MISRSFTFLGARFYEGYVLPTQINHNPSPRPCLPGLICLLILYRKPFPTLPESITRRHMSSSTTEHSPWDLSPKYTGRRKLCFHFCSEAQSCLFLRTCTKLPAELNKLTNYGGLLNYVNTPRAPPTKSFLYVVATWEGLEFLAIG
jgi:hypothetical protein